MHGFVQARFEMGPLFAKLRPRKFRTGYAHITMERVLLSLLYVEWPNLPRITAFQSSKCKYSQTPEYMTFANSNRVCMSLFVW